MTGAVSHTALARLPNLNIKIMLSPCAQRQTTMAASTPLAMARRSCFGSKLLTRLQLRVCFELWPAITAARCRLCIHACFAEALLLKAGVQDQVCRCDVCVNHDVSALALLASLTSSWPLRFLLVLEAWKARTWAVKKLVCSPTKTLKKRYSYNKETGSQLCPPRDKVPFGMEES